jgi:hypothetical protein
VHITFLQVADNYDDIRRSITIYWDVFVMFENIPRLVREMVIKERPI